MLWCRTSHRGLLLFPSASKAAFEFRMGSFPPPQDSICLKNTPLDKQEFTSYHSFYAPSRKFDGCAFQRGLHVYLSRWLNMLSCFTNSQFFSCPKGRLGPDKWIELTVSSASCYLLRAGQWFCTPAPNGTTALFQYSWTLLNMASCGQMLQKEISPSLCVLPVFLTVGKVNPTWHKGLLVGCDFQRNWNALPSQKVPTLPISLKCVFHRSRGSVGETTRMALES